MARPNKRAVRQRAQTLRERGLDKVILGLPEGQFRMCDLEFSAGPKTIVLRKDGIIEKVRNGDDGGHVWRRGPNYTAFAEALRDD